MSKQITSTRKTRKGLSAILATLGLALMTPVAFAQTTGNSVGQVATTLGSQVPQIVDLATKFGFALGVFFLVMAIVKFKAHNDDARSTPLKTPFILLFVSVCLIALPWVSSIGEGTLGVNGQKNSAAGSVYNQL